MKKLLLLLICTFMVSGKAISQTPDTLVIEFQAPVGNRFSVQGLLALRSLEQSDLEEDGVPEIVFFEEDQQGKTTKVTALDGRTHAEKWQADLTNLNISANSLNKLEADGFTYTHRDSLIWRGFRRIRKVIGPSKSTSAGMNEGRLAVMSGGFGGVLAINPINNKTLLSLGDDFVLFAVVDIDQDGEEELIIGNKKTNRVFIVGTGRTE